MIVIAESDQLKTCAAGNVALGMLIRHKGDLYIVGHPLPHAGRMITVFNITTGDIREIPNNLDVTPYPKARIVLYYE